MGEFPTLRSSRASDEFYCCDLGKEAPEILEQLERRRLEFER